MTLLLLLLMGLFRTKSAASRRMSVLERRGDALRTKNVLLPELRDGPALACWCNCPCKQDNLRHNAMVMLLLGLYHPHLTDVATGYDTDDRLRPDATFTAGGERFHLELFLGRPHMGKAQVQPRMRQYLGDPAKNVPPCTDTVLVVSTSGPSKRRLMDWCRELGDLVYHATVQDLLRDRYGEVWCDGSGRKASINVAGNVNGNVNSN